MHRLHLHWLITISLALLSACGTSVVHEPTNKQVKKAVLSIAHGAGPCVVQQVTPNVLARASINFEPCVRFFDLDGFSLERALEHAIREQFANHGVEVVVVPFGHRLPKDIDAVIDITPSVWGYGFGPYGERSLGRLRPMVGMRVQITSTRTDKVLYSDSFAYSYQVPKAPGHSKYIFEDASALKTPGVAVDGLNYGASTVAAYLVSEFMQ